VARHDAPRRDWAALLLGYTLAFGGDHGGVIGDFRHLGFSGVGLEAKGEIPHLLFAAFQGMFAIITPALISGSVAERVKFSTYAVFISRTTCR